MSQSTLRRERARSFSAPASITFPVSEMQKPSSQKKAEVKLILEAALNSQGELRLIGANGDNKICTEVGQELNDLSDLIERELQGENWSFMKQVSTILAAIRNQDITIWEPFFEAVEKMINRQVCTKTFVNFTVFGIALVRRYKDETPNGATSWVIDVVAELIASAYERYHVNEWIQEQGGWRGILQLVRNKYHTFIDYVPVPRGLGSWRQTALAGGVMIGAIAAGAGVLYFR